MADNKYLVKNLKNFISTYRSTSGNYQDRIISALQSVTGYNSLNDAISAYQNDLADNYLLNDLSGIDFLVDKCNILLVNSDNGSAIGSDAGSGVPRSRLDSFYYCTQYPLVIPTESSETINGIKFNYDMTGLNSDHLNIVGQLSSRWLYCAIDLARRTFGFKSYDTGFFNSVDVEFLNRGVSLSGDIRDQEVAAAQITYDASGNATSAKLILNREYISSSTIQNDYYGTYVYNSGMTLVSAVVKAVSKIMLSMFIPNFYSWKDFMVDGFIDSVVGIDEEYDDVFSNYYDNFNYVVWGFENIADLTISGDDAKAQNLMTHTNGVSFLRYLFYNKEGYDALVQSADYGQTVNGTRYKTGVVYSYKEIFERFIEFAIGEPDDLNKWDLVDDRLNGFYGATLRCPMPEAVVPKTNQNKLDPGYVKNLVIVTTDELNCELESSGKPNNLGDTLVERMGINVEAAQTTSLRFSDMFSIYNHILDSMIADMNSMEDSSLYSTDIYALIFNGLERDIYEETKPLAQLLEDVITLTKKCVLLGINPVLIIHPSIYSYVNADSATTKFLDDIEILIQHPWDIEKEEGLKVVDGYALMRSTLGVKDFSWSDCVDYECETLNHFNYSFVKKLAVLIDNSMENLGSKYLEPCFYISLCYHNITTSTYENFKNHPSRYMTGTGKNWNVIVRGNTRYVRTPVGAVNLFKNTGEICQIMLHTTYDTNLWACEQGGCTCKHFADYPVDDSLGLCKTYARIQTQIRTNPPNHYHQAYWSTVGKPSFRWESNPVFPGTGTPWFCISSQNKTDYNTATVGYRYYFTRTNYTATITIRLAGTELLDDMWQSMSFGCMDVPHLDQYRFPLYVAGGSQALSPYVHYFARQDATDSYDTNVGLLYDLNMSNIVWLNSNLLTPCEANTNGYSNFRVLSSEGVWKSIVAMRQTYSAYTIRRCAPPNYVQSYEIQFTASDIGSYSDRFGSEYTYYINRYADARPTVMDMEMNNHAAIGIGFYRQLNGHFDESNEWVNLLFSIMPYLNRNLDYGESGILGVITDTYGIYDTNLEEGVYRLNNKHYLIVPDGWVKRLIGYKHYWPYLNLDRSAYDYNYFYERYYITPRIDIFHGKVAIRLD